MLISIIITSYNDCAIITPHFEAIRKTLSAQKTFDWEIIYVDDGSRDGSVEMLEQIAKENSEVTFIELTRNFGQQKAFRAGLKMARGDVIITLDGDFQYPPECLLELAKKITAGFDIVSGVRVNRKDPWLTRFASIIGQYFIRHTFQLPVNDFGSVKAFSRFMVHQIIHYDNDGANIYGLAYALTNRCTEIPVEHLPRPCGRSKWSLAKRFHVYLDLYLAYAPYESTSLLKMGGALFLLGSITLGILLYLYLAHDIFFFQSFTALASLGLTGIGLGLIVGSVFLSFLLRIYRQQFWKGDGTLVRRMIRDENNHFRRHSRL